MPLTPGYGETPLPHDELTALVTDAVEILDKLITRAVFMISNRASRTGCPMS